MSKKSLKILLVLVTILSLVTSFSFATEVTSETTGTDEATVTTTSDEGASLTTENSEGETSDDATINETAEGDDSATEASTNHDVYISEDEVKIAAEETINGNAFIIGNTVTINGQIGGDLFVLADTLNLDGGQVYGNVFTCANTITLNGLIYDLYAVCNTLNISYDCVAYRDIKAICDTATINGVIGKDVNISAGKSLTIEDDCVIYGDFNYYAPNQVETKEDLVKGANNYQGAPIIPNLSSVVKDLKASAQNKDFSDYIIAVLSTVIFALIVWFVMSKFAPKFYEKVTTTTPKDLLWAALIGLIALIAIPLISILLMITVVGVTVGLLLLTLYFVILSLSFATVSIALAKMLANKVPALAKYNNIFAVIIVAIVIWACGLIPYVGALVQLATILCGFGLFLKLLVSGKSKKEVTAPTPEDPKDDNEEKAE